MIQITRGKIIVVGVLVIVIGMLLSGWHRVIFEIFSGEIDFETSKQIAVGTILMTLGPWVIKLAKMIPKGGGG